MMRQLYNFSITLFKLGIVLASPFNQKATKWLIGRKNWKRELSNKLKNEKDLFWIHCSSLGEFEQGRPVIEALHRKGIKVLLTFFSPSGYENQKNFASAFHVAYLPADTLSNAKAFIKIVQPKAAFFVKYEFWFNYMKVLKKQSIPLFIISGIFRKDQYFFKAYGKWFANQLKDIRYFFVQNEESIGLLNSVGIHQCSISGDTRFDRVVNIVSNPLNLEEVKRFKGDSGVFIGGSTWSEDEKLIKEAYVHFKELKFIIVPHEVNKNHLKEINENFDNEGIYFTDLDKNTKDARLLIVDTVGKLSSLYQYADAAMIGGGFGKGIHNTLEAAAFSLPIAFGPNYSKFQEAKDLVHIKGAQVVRKPEDLKHFLKEVFHDNRGKKIGKINKEYVEEKKGATAIIMAELSSQGLI